MYGIIDLDHLPIGPRVYDLGHLLADMVKNRIYSPDQLDAWRAVCGALIGGYEQEITLSEREKSALSHSMLASQLLFIYWFVKHDIPELTAKNVDVLLWIYAHKEALDRQFRDGDASITVLP